MKESDIRNREIHNRYLELVRADADRFFQDRSSFTAVPCPACGSAESSGQFEKQGFTYQECAACETLYNSPRPPFAGLAAFYGESPSTRFWVNEFFMPMVEPRREKIFRPRAEFIGNRFPDLAQARIGDIGAGFGIFLEELGKLWPQADIRAIEPSVDMAEIIRKKGFPVIQAMVEEVPPADGGFDLLTSFELFEHLHDPGAFLLKVHGLLKPEGCLFMTTLNGLGFDIQAFWERSKSISPPHHLNFFNPSSIGILMERCGFELVEASTPGELDWDIVESAWLNEGIDPGRFFRTVARHGSAQGKKDLQAWVKGNGFSSHMRVIGRKRG